MVYVMIAIVLILTEMFYIRLVNKTSFFAAIHEREKDQRPVWSGAGLLLYLGMLFFSVIHGFVYPGFFFAITLLAVVGLWNNVKPISKLIQHLALWGSLLFMFNDLDIYNDSICCSFSLVLIVSVLIMYSFRAIDGVNRISGATSFVVLLTLAFINSRMVPFIDEMYLWIAIVLSFLLIFFNIKYRNRALGGEAGAGMLAVIVLFALWKLIMLTNDVSYLILMVVCVIDSIVTVVYRIFRRENIFESEGRHIYQLLVSRGNIPPIIVSFLYASVQSLIVAGYFILFPYRWLYMVCVLVMFILLYMYLEFYLRKLN